MIERALDMLNKQTTVLASFQTVLDELKEKMKEQSIKLNHLVSKADEAATTEDSADPKTVTQKGKRARTA